MIDDIDWWNDNFTLFPLLVRNRCLVQKNDCRGRRAIVFSHKTTKLTQKAKREFCSLQSKIVKRSIFMHS